MEPHRMEGDAMPHNDQGGFHTGKPPKRTFEHKLAGGNHRKDGCCSYQLAGRALSKGKGRLALRYVRMDVKARLGYI